MSFSQAGIDAVAGLDGSDLRVSWTTTAPAGTWYQVYVNNRLAWSGRETVAILPYPTALVELAVGAVADGEQDADFTQEGYGQGGYGQGGYGRVVSLPPLDVAPAPVELRWQGGAYEVADPSRPQLAGFRVYGSDAPGGAIDYAAAIATVPAAIQGVRQGGYGQGGYGKGGYGSTASDYTCTTRPLCGGTWQFGVKAFDEAGVEGAADTVSIAVPSVPRAPAPDALGRRLTYNNFHIVMGQAFATLNWLASPACS